MPTSIRTRFLNCLQFESIEEECHKNIWFRWLQLLVGTAGFLVSVSYGYFIRPIFDLPITLTCFFISSVGLMNALLAFLKLLNAYRIKRRHASAKPVNELNLEPKAEETAECNGTLESTFTGEEIEKLRKMLKQALSSHAERHKTEGHNKIPPPLHQVGHGSTLSPYNPVQNWTNPQWNDRKFPPGNRLQRTESYESSLRFHQSYNSGAYSSTRNCSSSSERDTYVYTSSSDGGRSSVYGWKKNLGRIPLVAPVTMPTSHIISHINRNIEHLRMERDQFTPKLPIDLPEQFPALPFPKRNQEVEKYRERHPESRKQFQSPNKKEGSIASSLTKSRSVINIDKYGRISRRDTLRILAHLSPAISMGAPLKPKRKKHCRKHSVPKTMNIRRA